MSRKSGTSLLVAAAAIAVIALFSTARPAAAHGFGYCAPPAVAFYGPAYPYYYYRPYPRVRVFAAFPYPRFFRRHAHFGFHHFRGFHHGFRGGY